MRSKTLRRRSHECGRRNWKNRREELSRKNDSDAILDLENKEGEKNIEK